MAEANRSEYVFEFSGGRLCLDFANTLSALTGEHLAAYADLVAWGRQGGVLTDAEARHLLAAARRRPAQAAQVLARAKALRGAIHRAFAALAAGRLPTAADLDALNAELALALARARVVSTADGFTWGWDADRDALDRPLWPVARSAAELLASGERHLVRECGGAHCRWLFMDTTKNRRRQWCDMRVCGNRAKARRYYERRRTGGRPPGEDARRHG